MISLQSPTNFWQGAKNNFVAGMYSLFASQRAFDLVRPSFKQFILWSILGGASNTLLSWLIYGDIGHFNMQGLVSYIVWPFLALLAGIIIAQNIKDSRMMFVPVILWLVLDVYILASQILIQLFSSSALFPTILNAYISTIFFILFIWQSFSIVLILSRALQWRWKNRMIIFAGTLVTLFAWQYSSKSQPIWKIAEIPPTLSEEVFYTQPKLLNNALSKIQINNIEQREWYFVGVAGANYQDVFKSEIERIKHQFDTRFNTQGRSIALINHANTALNIPFASKTSLEYTLKDIGQKMNREQDVLFLYLTSHGIEHQFQLENPPLSLDNIDPIWLRKTLDASGIRWRVIVISACRSGSFIPALQSPDSLIITASASDKDSFGCTNEAEYTYFGRAFFDQAMREKHSIKEAFILAQNTVGKWEQNQGFIPSEPQWSIGKNMESMLPQFEKVLFPQANINDERPSHHPISEQQMTPMEQQ